MFDKENTFMSNKYGGETEKFQKSGTVSTF